jgi:hypothetical protein
MIFSSIVFIIICRIPWVSMTSILWLTITTRLEKCFPIHARREKSCPKWIRSRSGIVGLSVGKRFPCPQKILSSINQPPRVSKIFGVYRILAPVLSGH